MILACQIQVSKKRNLVCVNFVIILKKFWENLIHTEAIKSIVK